MAAEVDILLATFNAGGYLRRQIDSLLAQTFTDWRLLIRDDCSRDDTPRVSEQYAAQDPQRIVVIDGPIRNEGSCRNFASLLECSTAPYILFCDQDDVWLPEKIERSLDCLQRLEAVHGADTPLLVHSDLRVVDDRLRPVADSFWAFHSLDPEPARPFRRLCVQNFVTGCASIFNRSLRNIAVPIPEAALVHDWWLALVAAGLGRIGRLSEATVLYRQHGRNQIGASRPPSGGSAARQEARRRAGLPWWRRPLFPGLRWIRQVMRRRELQVGALVQRCDGRLAAGDLRAAEVFSTLSRRGFARRRYDFVVHRFSASGRERTLQIWLSI